MQKLKVFLIPILFILLNIKIIAQSDPLADIFLSHQPIWSHCAFDTSAIGYKGSIINFNGRTGRDFFINLAKVIYNGNYAYLVYTNSFEIFSGSFLEKVDLKSGKVLWQNYFDLRNSTNREWTNECFINKNKELVLLNFRNYDYQDTSQFPNVLWNTGKLSIRKFDIETGQQIQEYFTPNDNPNFPQFNVNADATRLHENIIGGYDYYEINPEGLKGLARYKIQMTNDGTIIKSDTFYMPLKYRYIDYLTYTPRLLNNQFDTLISMRFNYESLSYTSVDTMDLNVDLFNSQFGLINSYNISNKITKVKNYALYPAKNNNIPIVSTEYFKDNTFPRERIIMLNTQGEVTEEIMYQTRINDPFGKIIGVYKLKHEPGALILNSSIVQGNPGMEKLIFLKSDGQGNVAVIRELIMKDHYQISSNNIEQMENGNVLLIGNYVRLDLPNNVRDTSRRFITSLWDGKQLGLISSTDQVKSPLLSISIYPNPSSEIIHINGLDSKQTLIHIYDQEGNLIISREVEDIKASSFDISHLTNGMYLVQLYDKNNQFIYCGKFMKVDQAK